MDKKKKIIIGAVAGVIVIVAAIVCLLLFRKKKDEYRIIKVYSVEGEAVVNRKNTGELAPYANMILESGDNVKVFDGMVTLKLDDDKFVYAQPNTEFDIKASGSAKNSKTTINLKEGSIANDIQRKLSDDSYYEINTPNSTMSVRGTVYYVSTYMEDGKRYTKVSVFDGKVETDLVSPSGDKMKKQVMVDKGYEVIICEDEEKTEYVGNGIREIDYSELPADVINLINEIQGEENRKVALPKEVVDDVNKGPFTVTFVYNGTTFGTQTVEWGNKVEKPSLQPAKDGAWDYDFGSTVTEDIVIEWK